MATILIVDDSPTDIFQLKTFLEENNYTVIDAQNGAEAVVVARAELPDLILMDVIMPEVNGFQATRQIKKSPITKHIPVIMITTKNQKTDQSWGKRQGASQYLTKPVDGTDLLNAIDAELS